MKLKRADLRFAEEKIMRCLMKLSLLLVLVALGSILVMIFWRGFSSLSIEMLTQTPRGGFYLGKEGGILNAITGSAILAASATLLAALMSIPIVLFTNIYTLRDSLTARIVRFGMDILWGVPSIVYGAFGFLIMIRLGLRASLGAAIITVSLFELPIMVRAMDEVIRCIPFALTEASAALGATRLETALRVVLRQSAPGLLTGILMAFGRGIGDTASVLFTAGFTDRLPGSLADPVATLPLAIFFQLGTPFPEVQGRAYASAVVLTVMVLAVSICSRIITRRYTKFKI